MPPNDIRPPRSRPHRAETSPSITRWDHPDLSAEVAGIRGEVNGPRFDAILDVNRDPSGPAVRPARVTLAEEQWRRPEALEFLVDFETVNDCDSDFSQLAARGGQPSRTVGSCSGASPPTR